MLDAAGLIAACRLYCQLYCCCMTAAACLSLLSPAFGSACSGVFPCRLLPDQLVSHTSLPPSCAAAVSKAQSTPLLHSPPSPPSPPVCTGSRGSGPAPPRSLQGGAGVHGGGGQLPGGGVAEVGGGVAGAGAGGVWVSVLGGWGLAGAWCGGLGMSVGGWAGFRAAGLGLDAVARWRVVWHAWAGLSCVRRGLRPKCFLPRPSRLKVPTQKPASPELAHLRSEIPAHPTLSPSPLPSPPAAAVGPAARSPPPSTSSTAPQTCWRERTS